MAATIENNRDWFTYWASVGERNTRDQLYEQVGRTIGGKPIPERQIDLLVNSIRQQLDLTLDDVLLDLCCGNGLVTHRLSPLCKAIVGVDYALELIDTARTRNAAPNIIYLHRTADALRASDFPGSPPTKMCMNGALQHFDVTMFKSLLESLRTLTPDNLMLYFTDIPDVAKIRAFYNTPERWAEFERRRVERTEAIGTWWDRDDLAGLMTAAGYACRIIDPEPERSTAHYRFDVLAHLVN